MSAAQDATAPGSAAPGFAVQRLGDVLTIAGRITDNAEHRHHAMQIVWSSSAQPACLDHQGARLTGRTLIIDGGVPHRLTLESGLVCLVEAQSAVVAAIRRRLLGDAPVWSSDAPHAVAAAAGSAMACLDALAGGWAPAHHIDHRVARVLGWLDALEASGRFAEASLPEAMRLVELSQSRFLHLFTQHMRTPWRRYLVWRRALCAIDRALKGGTLTEAAHAVGYADSAHLSRQFRALFGYTPSAARRRSQFVQA